MHTGRDIHRDLVRRIRKVRRGVDRLEREIDGLQHRMAETGERRGRTVRKLAEFHLPGMNEESVADSLAGVEADIRAIHEEKKERFGEVERRIPKQREVVGAAEAALATVTAALNETGEERARLARIAYEELQGMPGWRSLFEQVRRLEARVAASGRRHEMALREQEDKTPAYEGDPFFAYLWRRRYGTRAAIGNPLTRRLDRWVAAVTDYEAVRERYDLLNALPGHAAAVLDEDREALAAATTPLAALHDERGSYYERAIDGIETYLEGHSLHELVAMARDTDDPRDDVLVADLGELDAELADLRGRLAERREKRSELSSRLADLEDLRHRFERDDWNGRRSRFDDGLDLNSLLLGFLAGRHSSGHVHRVLSHNHSFLPVGGGGFGGGGFSGGGFSTGGGFGGGGGFSTGGGF